MILSKLHRGMAFIQNRDGMKYFDVNSVINFDSIELNSCDKIIDNVDQSIKIFIKNIEIWEPNIIDNGSTNIIVNINTCAQSYSFNGQDIKV
jgi:hypothetical protein